MPFVSPTRAGSVVRPATRGSARAVPRAGMCAPLGLMMRGAEEAWAILEADRELFEQDFTQRVRMFEEGKIREAATPPHSAVMPDLDQPSCPVTLRA